MNLETPITILGIAMTYRIALMLIFSTSFVISLGWWAVGTISNLLNKP